MAYTLEKKDPITDEWLNTRVELTPVRKGKTFNKNGINVKVEYTSEELSFLQKRTGEYNKQDFPTLFESEEYQNADNYYKQHLSKGQHSNSKKKALADLLGQDFEGSLGAFENFEGVGSRIEEKAREIYEQKVLSKNFGKPLTNELFPGEE